MTQHNPKSHTEHQEIVSLLPWYVNKTLQGTELKAVESHLGTCLTCKRELAQLQKLAQAVIKEGSLDSAEQASFSRLKMRLHGQQNLQQVVGNPIDTDNVIQLSKPRKQRWSYSAINRPALAMAAAMLLSLTVLLPRFVDKDMQLANSFRTLSEGQPEKTINANEIRVVFAENIDQQQKNTILDRVHGQIIDNPTAQGVYTIRLNRDIAAKHLLDVVELLRKDNNVIFAEPAYALLSSAHSE